MNAIGLILITAAAFAQPHTRFEDISGTLIDAACEDRSALNLQQPAAPPNLASQPPSRPMPAAGVKVDAKTLQKERADAMAHQNPDVLMRQSDRSCAVTGATRGFALLMSNGRLVNLDEGGNTLALQAIQSTPEGRAMLNGTGGAMKPQVTFRGRVQGDRVIVERILKL